MATDEEYLDSLLKAMTETEQAPRNMDEVMKSMNMESENKDDFSLNSDDLADMLDKIEEKEGIQPVIEEIQEEAAALHLDSVDMPIFSENADAMDGFIDSGTSDMPVFSQEADVHQISETEEMSASDNVMADDDFIRRLIAQQEALEAGEVHRDEEIEHSEQKEAEPVEWSEEMLPEATPEQVQMIDEWNVTTSEDNSDVDLMNLLAGENNSFDEASTSVSEAELENMDVTELIDNMEEMQDDLLEINDLLKKADNNEYVEAEGENADFLALLGGLQEEEVSEESFIWGNETSTSTDEIGIPEELLELTEKPSKKDKKQKRKEKEKKNNKKALFGKKEKIADIDENSFNDNGESTSSNTNKKPGRLASFFTYLTEEIPDADENTEILNELELEDAQKLKTKKKKSKKKEKKADESSKKEQSAQKAAKKAEKKEKKALKKQEKSEAKKAEKAEPSKKVLGKKGRLVLVAFCASLIAAIFALSIFLPDYVDKNEAREAFYVGDYETVYKFLYGKRLNDNDQLIYQRAETVLSLQRKLDSYENNKVLEREVEALEALLYGVIRYSELENVAEIGIQGEVDAIYNQICGILLNSYGLTAEDVFVIMEYEDIKYSRTIYDLVAGKGFVRPGEEIVPQENSVPQDILPEEEDIIQLN